MNYFLYLVTSFYDIGTDEVLVNMSVGGKQGGHVGYLTDRATVNWVMNHMALLCAEGEVEMYPATTHGIAMYKTPFDWA